MRAPSSGIKSRPTSTELAFGQDMAASALAPYSSYRLRPRSAARLLLLCSSTSPRNPSQRLNIPTNPPLFLPSLNRLQRSFLPHAPSDLSSIPSHKRFCRGIAGALFSADPKTESADNPSPAGSEKVREFRKRLRIVDIKGGPDEGLDRLEQVLLVRGWVRTCRAQSSVTFIEVRSIVP